MGNSCSNDKNVSKSENDEKVLQKNKFEKSHSDKKDVIILKEDVKSLQKKIEDDNIEISDYDTRSDDIKKKLKMNIENLSKINKELEQENDVMQDKLKKMTDNQKRGCRYVKCLNLEIEKNRILRENEDLRNLLLKAETAEKTLVKLQNNENRCMKKIQKLQKFMEKDHKLIIELSNQKRYLQTRINLLNEELMNTKYDTKKQGELRTLENKIKIVDHVFLPKKTLEEQLIYVKGHIKDLENQKMKLENDSKNTKRKLKLAKRESYFERRIKNGKSFSEF